MKKLLKENKYLTKKAKSLFGDGVVAAFNSIDWFEEYDDRKLILGDLEFISNENYDTNGIELDGSCRCLFIKFSNGKLLCFTVSEWGRISNIKDDDNSIEFIE